MCRRAYEQLLPYFEDMLESQGWLDTQEKSDKILEYIDTSTATVEARQRAHGRMQWSGTARARVLMRPCSLFLCVSLPI